MLSVLYFCIFLVVIAASSSIIGLFLFLKPTLAIEIQKRFYAKINWRIEPIDFSKEIRNTKIMGIFLFSVTLVLGSYFLSRR